MTSAPSTALRFFQPSDLRGLARLGLDGTVGLTHLVEAMHHTIASRVGIVAVPPAGRTRGITGAVYGTVRGSMGLVGRGLDMALRLAEGPSSGKAGAPEREAFVAAVNGVWGDHLADSGNPLAISMSLRSGDIRLDADRPVLSDPRSKLLVMAHGLCMNDLQWQRRGHDHGRALADETGATPLYLHYNSGRHVSQNGREFAELLERTIARWPVPVQEVTIVGHSMGGLVARSACQQAEQLGHAWLARLKSMVFLGTPHHGAALERGGRRIDQLLSVSPYVAPFARLGKARSAGITDLRYGNLRDADWQGRDRHAQHHDDRLPTPLPRGVRAFALAATSAERADALKGLFVGDGLVSVASALGQHANPALALALPPSRQRVVTSCGHLDLLCNPEVLAQLRRWIARR